MKTCIAEFMMGPSAEGCSVNSLLFLRERASPKPRSTTVALFRVSAGRRDRLTKKTKKASTP